MVDLLCKSLRLICNLRNRLVAKQTFLGAFRQPRANNVCPYAAWGCNLAAARGIAKNGQIRNDGKRWGEIVRPGIADLFRYKSDANFPALFTIH